MGKHTAYWNAYSRAQVRGTLRVLAAIVLWGLAIAGLALAQAYVGGAFPWLMGGALFGLAITLVLLSRHAYRVVCPECGATYQRSKWHGQCPQCGLGLLQPDP